uniref:Hemolysin activation/secretion protein n=1 Tax=Candidatus Kentrum sp. DK TaxID=2126562 RepID=A0A450SHM8_9GAMM|nr:MAG: Hemolysin activation/secretion protein [Candidatus Kentron sp. DK]
MSRKFAVIFLLLSFSGISLSSEDADRLEQLFELREEPKSTVDALLPELAPRVTVGEFPEAPFRLEAVEILGSSVYTDADLEPLYSPYLHRPGTRKRLRDLAEAIIRQYEADGYPYTQILVEPLVASEGAVKIRIREAFIDNVVVQGEPKGKKDRFADLISKIKAMRPIRRSDIERYILLASDLGGIYKISAEVQASESNPGAYTLVLSPMLQNTVMGFVVANNRGTEAVGPVFFVPGALVFNPFGYFGKTSLKLATTPETKELRFLSAEHELPLNDAGTKLKLRFSYTTSHPGTVAAEMVDANSRAQTFSFGVSHPFVRTQRTNFTGYGKFDIKQSDRRMHTLIPTFNNFGQPVGSIDVHGKYSEDKTRILRAGADFDYADSTDGITRLQLEWSHGLSGFGAKAHDPLTESLSFLAKNDDGVADFDKITYALSRTQPLAFVNPKLEKWSAYGAIEGQISADPLLASEECGIGGRYMGRAYDSSEITGENCIGASFELRRDIGGSPIEWLPDSQGYLFYDIGKVEQKGNPIGQTDESLSSLGAGLTFQIPPYVSLSLEVAKPLTREVANEEDKSLRTFASIFAVF